MGLARATQDATVFTSLDFAIAGLIMQGLVDTENIINETMVSQSTLSCSTHPIVHCQCVLSYPQI